MPPHTVTRARTRSATSRARSAASTCRTSRRSGSGTSSRSKAARPSPGAPAVAGRLLERSKGKDTTAGHWELMGVVTADAVPDVPARLSARRDRPVHAPHRPRRARQQGGLGHGDHPGARRGAPAHGQVDRLHVGRLRLPGRGARGDDPARGAVRGLPDRARDPDRQARGRPRDRPPVRRRARELRAHAEPARLLAPAEAAELPDARPRGRQDGARRRQDRRHLRRPRHRRVAADASRTSTGSSRPRRCCARSTRA